MKPEELKTISSTYKQLELANVHLASLVKKITGLEAGMLKLEEALNNLTKALLFKPAAQMPLISFQAPKGERAYELKTCKYCKSPIHWPLNWKKGQAPLNPDGSEHLCRK